MDEQKPTVDIVTFESELRPHSDSNRLGFYALLNVARDEHLGDYPGPLNLSALARLGSGRFLRQPEVGKKAVWQARAILLAFDVSLDESWDLPAPQRALNRCPHCGHEWRGGRLPRRKDG